VIPVPFYSFTGEIRGNRKYTKRNQRSGKYYTKAKAGRHSRNIQCDKMKIKYRKSHNFIRQTYLSCEKTDMILQKHSDLVQQDVLSGFTVNKF